MEPIKLGLAATGALTFGYGTLQLASLIWTFLIRPSELPRYGHCKEGSWALITGASDGIGLGFVHELLSENFNVLMHGRNAEKLRRIAQELGQQYPHRKVAIVVADASDQNVDLSGVVDIVKQLPGKLTVLVNNVGGVTTKPQYLPLHEVTAKDIDNQMNVNARFPTQITRVLLPILKQNQPSLIMNTGSVGGFMGVPYIVTYCATKGYVHSFSKALMAEMFADGYAPAGGTKYEAAKGVEVMGCLIGNTASAGNTSDKDFFTISARQLASACLDRVGAGKALVWAHWKHRLQWFAVSLMPEYWVMAFGAPIMRKRVEDEKRKVAEDEKKGL